MASGRETGRKVMKRMEGNRRERTSERGVKVRRKEEQQKEKGVGGSDGGYV